MAVKKMVITNPKIVPPPKNAMWAFAMFGFLSLLAGIIYLISGAGWKFETWSLISYFVLIFFSGWGWFGYYLLMCYCIQAWCTLWEAHQILRLEKALKRKEYLTKDISDIEREAQRVEELKKERKLREEGDRKIFELEQKLKKVEIPPPNKIESIPIMIKSEQATSFIKPVII
jgi:hypothetical protein